MKQVAIQRPSDIPQVSNRFEVIEPPRLLRELVSYFERSSQSETPVAAAERAVAQLEFEFGDWRTDMLGRLQAAWHDVETDPGNSTRYQLFQLIIHEVYGNASLLNCPAAGTIAGPITRLLERCPDIAPHLAVIGLAISCIDVVASQGIPADDALVVEVVDGLGEIVERWITL